ncbi:MAG: carbon-nitrogen family hydrolase [Candidatus Hermodarchaeota archaeon]|jgi:omega-amidase|nr:carbon-nitrogen family hydrolase [Candidatus Hermodarchaeota archaeon]
MEFRVACAQMDIALGNKEVNLETAAKLVKEAAQNKIDLMLFPELFQTGYCLDKAELVAEPPKGHTVELLRELAGRFRIFIVAGSILEKRDHGIFNTCHLIGKDGKLLGSYDKIHLFPPFDENRYLTAGNNASIFKTGLGLFGAIICFDIRFPELTRRLALSGAQVIFCPAEFPAERTAIWATLLRARAIENQVFVVGCNRVGSDGKHLFGGHSAIIHPNGQALAQATASPQLIEATINLDELRQIREELPVLKYRREDY